MPLNRRLEGLFPEYRFSEDSHISISEAYSILESVASDRGVDLVNLHSRAIDDFISVVRYAPSNLSTLTIARRTGVLPMQPQPRQVVARASRGTSVYATLGSLHNDTSELRQIGSSVQGIQSSPTLESDYARFVREIEGLYSNPSQEIGVPDLAIPTLELDTESAMRPMEDTLDFWYNPQVTMSSTPRPTQKKKKMRSEMDMVREIVRGENFPRPNFKDWEDRNELERIYEDWNRNVEYREHWIFSRREREGFNRRQVSQFSLDDVIARLSKRKKPHVLDSSFSKFYDWKLGGTDWILRLELFQDKDIHFLIVRHIHRPTDTEIKFDVRYWSVGANQFKSVNSIWTEATNREDRFERVFGSSNPDSPCYIPSYEEDEIADGEYYEEDFEEDFEEESSW